MTLKLPPGCAVGSSDAEPLAARAYSEPAHPYRPPFSRDRARIIHARAFRRLAGKTQVFTERSSDHFRSRLTHTMEVAQIARTMATALGLNADLTESLALVHDIGHPPFGHAGEHALDMALRKHGQRFDHNLHALRIVEYFEHRYAAFPGLNLTLGVREGIIKHSRDYSAKDHPELAECFLDERPPLEAQLIDLADEIAYLAADLDDGMEAGILDVAHVRGHVQSIDRFYVEVELEYPGVRQALLFNETIKRMLNALVGDLMATTVERVNQHGVTDLHGVRSVAERLVMLSPEIEKMRLEVKEYLYKNLYQCDELLCAQEQASEVVRTLFAAWVAEPALLPADHQARIAREGVARTVADYIAGMTDSFIRIAYQNWMHDWREIARPGEKE